MTSRREWFHTYEPISGGSVYTGDDHALEIAGFDTIKIKMFDGTIRTFGEVRHEEKSIVFGTNRQSWVQNSCGEWNNEDC